MTARSTHSPAVIPSAPGAALRSAFGPLGRLVAGVVRRHRNAAAAEHLRELPAHLLADIGIDRSGIEDIRLHGRPLRRTTGVDIGGRRP